MRVSKYRIEIPFGHVPQDVPTFDFPFDMSEEIRELPLSNIFLNRQQVEDIARWGRDENDPETIREFADAMNRPMRRIVGGSIVHTDATGRADVT